jgi:hypothetical protein
MLSGATESLGTTDGETRSKALVRRLVEIVNDRDLDALDEIATGQIAQTGTPLDRALLRVLPGLPHGGRERDRRGR